MAWAGEMEKGKGPSAHKREEAVFMGEERKKRERKKDPITILFQELNGYVPGWVM